MFCPNCGANIPDNSSFCTNCGTNVRAGPAAPPAYPPYPAYQPYAPVLPLKSEALALVLAILIPGAGQIYAGKIARGLAVIISYFGAGVAIWLLWWSQAFNLVNTNDPSDIFGASSWLITLTIIIAIIMVVIWIVQLIDAYTQTKKYNDLLRQTGKAPW